MIRRLLLVASLLAAVLQPANAHADDAQSATCVEAHREAQRLRREEKLMESRARLVACAGAGCPTLVQQDCTKWLDEVGQSIPSVVVSAKDEGGHELSDVKVSVKDHFEARAVDGTPIELDPGAYTFHYDRPGAEAVEREVVLQTGVRNRVVEVTFPGGKPAPKARPKPPVVAYVLAGAGAVALGSFTYFGLKGRSEYNDARNECGSSCPPEYGDAPRRDFLIADVSLGVAALSLAGAAYFFFAWTPSESSSGEVGKRPTFHVGATPRGAFASVGSSF